MIWLETLLVALSTYTALPMPQFPWNEKNMRYAICFFPAAGLVCSLGLWAWWALSRYLGVSAVLFAAVAVCLPLLLTGGIHMDGYMDTVDALASHQSRERMLEIMKDSGCGAFAAIYCGVYLLLSFGLWHTAYALDAARAAVPMFLLSRGLSAFCAVTMPNARKSGMLCAFTENVHQKAAVRAIITVLVLTAAAMTLWAPVSGSLQVAAGLLTMLWYRHMAIKTFGGVTGDLAGFFLQICELMMLLAAVLGGLLL